MKEREETYKGKFGHCPECHEKLRCSCKSCAPKNKGKIMYVWEDGESIKCGKCGLSERMEWWEDRDWELDRPNREIAEREK